MYQEDSQEYSQNVFQSKSISCEKIPFLDKQIAKDHFSQFGRMTRFILRPKRLACTVEYDSVESAERAIAGGGSYNGQKFNIFYTPPSNEQPKSDDFVDPDVQAELESMQGPRQIVGKSVIKQSLEGFFKKTSDRFPPSAIRSTRQLPPPRVEVEQPKINLQLMSAARNDFEAMARKPARTCEEKYQVLDMRDKYYRTTVPRSNDIKNAVSTKGTCKDMCPEKERWMRETTYQVTSFETALEGGMNHRLAVKQYSRSSADQEAPLPYELRSEEVLNTTMTYLLHRIVNLCDDPRTNISDWFHFLWDRTRSIRKDITQQELCSPEAVNLVEQCARFHIHCSARLIAEDPSVFDQKINTENLTKCLQTLKYMYSDLKLKQISCKNESEIRAFIILLNLNDGNFLWEIMQLEDKIRKSQEIRFALQVYFALENNNYVKFFQLVRHASYMNACILMRYFNQVRIKALEIVLKAYTFSSKTEVCYSISHLTQVLAFEDYEQTVQYLQYHGLNCQPEENAVYLDRKRFYFPDSPFLMERAINLVERKRLNSVAEAVCGGPLNSPACFENHQPHSSFDQDGLLKKESYIVDDQKQLKIDTSESIFKVPAPSPPISPANFHRQSITSRLGTKVDQVDNRPSLSVNPFENKKSTFSTFSIPSFTTPASSSQSIFGSNTFTSPKVSSPTTTPASPTTPGSIFGNFVRKEQSQMPPFIQEKVKSPPFGLPSLTGDSSNSINFGKPIFGGFGGNSEKSIFENTFNMNLAAPQAISEPSFFTLGQNFRNSASDSKQLSINVPLPTSQLSPLISPKSPNLQFIRPNSEDARREQEEVARAAHEKEQNRIKLEIEEKLLNIEKEKALLEKLEKEQLLKNERERNKNINEASDRILAELLGEIVKDEVKCYAANALQNYVEVPKIIYKEISEEVIEDQIQKIYRQEFLAYVNQLKLKYNMLSKYFVSWRENVKSIHARKEKIANISCCMTNEEFDRDNFKHPEQNYTLLDMKRYLSGSPTEIKLPNHQVQKIDVIKALEPLRKIKRNILEMFWKLSISIPFRNEESHPGFYSFIDKWLDQTFKNDNEKKVLFLADRSLCKSRRKLSVCLRKLKGQKLQADNGALDAADNSNGILFIATSKNLEATAIRLRNAIAKLSQPSPISIIIYTNKLDEDEQQAAEKLAPSFLGNPMISDYEIVFYYETSLKNKNLSETMIESLQFLHKNHLTRINEFEGLYDLEMQSTTDFLSICLGEELWHRVGLSLKQNEAFARKLKQFNNVIELYNRCVQHLLDFTTKSDFERFPSLPSEFRVDLQAVARVPMRHQYFPDDWKSNDRQNKLRSFLQALKLTNMKETKFQNFDDLNNGLLEFCRSNFGRSQLVHQKMINYLSNNDSELHNINWLQILSTVFLDKLIATHDEFISQLPQEIVYSKKIFTSYVKTPWWLQVSETLPTSIDEPVTKRARLAGDYTKNELDSILSRSAKCLENVDEKIHKFNSMSNLTQEVSKDFDNQLFKCEQSVRSMIMKWEDKL